MHSSPPAIPLLWASTVFSSNGIPLAAGIKIKRKKKHLFTPHTSQSLLASEGKLDSGTEWLTPKPLPHSNKVAKAGLLSRHDFPPVCGAPCFESPEHYLTLTGASLRSPLPAMQSEPGSCEGWLLTTHNLPLLPRTNPPKPRPMLGPSVE